MCLEAAASEICERRCELADRALALGQFAQHPAARGIAQGVEDGVQLGCV